MTTGLDAPPPPVSAPDTTAAAVTTAYVPVRVTGDGTTTGSRAARRWRAARWPLAVLLLIAIVAGLAALSRPAVSSTPFAPDNAGPNEINYKLGLERAEAVKRYLYEQHQVPLHKINVISYGEEKPIAPNKTKAGRAQNRRVVIKVLT